VLLRVVDIGLRGGWAEFEGHPIQLPHLQLDHFKPRRADNLSNGNDQLKKATASADGEKVPSSAAEQIDSVAKSASR
jgi:optic atrophy 3 protein